MPQLLYTDGGDVMMADIHGRIKRILVPSQGRGFAVGVAYHWYSQTAFWSDTNTQKVRRSQKPLHHTNNTTSHLAQVISFQGTYV